MERQAEDGLKGSNKIFNLLEDILILKRRNGNSFKLIDFSFKIKYANAVELGYINERGEVIGHQKVISN